MARRSISLLVVPILLALVFQQFLVSGNGVVMSRDWSEILNSSEPPTNGTSRVCHGEGSFSYPFLFILPFIVLLTRRK